MADPAFPLRSSQHPQHSAMWIVPGFAFSEFCIACAITRLSQPNEFLLFKRKILTEFTAVLASEKGQAFAIFNEDSRVQHHLAFTTLDILCDTNAEELWTVATDALLSVTRLSSSRPLTLDVLQAVYQRIGASKTKAFPHGKTTSRYLKLMSSVLEQRKDVVMEFLNLCGGFLELLICLLKHQEWTVSQNALLVTSHFLQDHTKNTLPSFFLIELCSCVKKLMVSAKANDLSTLLSIMEGLLCIPSCAHELLSDKSGDSKTAYTVAAVFKRVLMSADRTLQVSGLQCLWCILDHCPAYTDSLLREDIAELLFEGLKAKDGQTVKAIYTCLHVITTNGTFYSNFHAVFGMDPIVTNLQLMMQLRNWENVNLGLVVLQNVLSKQPHNMPLFTDTTLITRLLELHKSLLSSNVDSLELKAYSSLAALLMEHHIPSSFQLQNFLPILALCQYKFDIKAELEDSNQQHDESLLTVHVNEPSKSDREGQTQLQEFLPVISNFFSIYLTRNEQNKTEEMLSFVLQAFETSIVPTFLLTYGSVLEKSCIGVFSLGSDLMDQLDIIASRLLAKHLALSLCSVVGGFVQIALEAVDIPSINQCADRCKVVDRFLTVTCTKSIELLDATDSHYTKEVLTSQVTKLRDSMLKCIKSTTSLFGSSVDTTSVTRDMRTRQGLLCLLFVDCLHGNRLLTMEELQNLISNIVTSTPHLIKLPVATLKHLIFITSVCDSDAHSDLKGYQLFQSSQQTLLQALSNLPDPSVVFVPHPTPLEWIIRHFAVIQNIIPVISSWLSKVVVLDSCQDANKHFFGQGPQEYLVSLAIHWKQGCEMLLNLLISSNCPETCSRTTDVIHLTISNCTEHKEESTLTSTIASTLVGHLSNQSDTLRVDKAQRILSILSHIYGNPGRLRVDQPAVQTILKLTRRSVNLMTRTSGDQHNLMTRTGGDQHNLMTRAAGDQQGILSPEVLRLLYSLLTCSESTPFTDTLVSYLIGNETFLQHLVGSLPKTPKPKDHSILSAHALLVCSALVYHSSQPQSVGSVELQLPTFSLLAALLNCIALVQSAAIQMWSAIFVSHGNLKPFSLSAVEFGSQDTTKTKGPQTHKESLIFTLHFILQNLVLNDIDEVSCEAATCLLLLFGYLKKTNPKLAEALTQHKWSSALLDYIDSRPKAPSNSVFAELADLIRTGRVHPVPFKLRMPPFTSK